MSQFIDQLRERVNQTRSDLESARRELSRATDVENGLATDLRAYERALQAETKHVDGAGAAREAAAIQEKDTAGHDLIEGALSTEPVNKTEYAANLVIASNGLTPPEIFRDLTRHGLIVHRNYVYSMLSRLVAQGRIKERKGKYVGAADDAYLKAGKGDVPLTVEN